MYKLLQKSTRWLWTQCEQSAFEKSKELLSSKSVLVHFDPSREILLACDASSYGIGADLSHKMPDGSEKPIAFASRTLSKAEKNYSQIEKEGLACVFGVKRFHTLLYGHKFTLITDHQPLLSLFNEAKTIPIQAAARIQRWALTLAAYEYVIQCKPTARHSNADALSHLPLPSGAQDTKTPVPPETVLLIEHLQSSLVTATHIKKETAKDPLLSRILQFVQTNWPSSCPNEEAKPYWQRRLEISVQDECLLWGNRVIVPPKLREAVLSLLHERHPGIVRMKSLGHMSIWWPGLNQSIEDLVRSCTTCQSHGDHRPQPLYNPRYGHHNPGHGCTWITLAHSWDTDS